MPFPHHFLPSTTLILTLLQCLHPVSSQTTTSTPTVLPSYNFTYPIFPDQYHSGIQVSYKDTIDVSWIANGEQHTPVLQIQCWSRNDSSSFIYSQNPPSHTHNLTKSPSPTYPLPLSPYRQYSPCELRLLDPDQTNVTEGSDSVTSIAFFISQDTNASTPGVTWSVSDEAPKVAVDAGVATAASGSAGKDHIGAVGGMWAVVGAVVAAVVLM